MVIFYSVDPPFERARQRPFGNAPAPLARISAFAEILPLSKQSKESPYTRGLMPARRRHLFRTVHDFVHAQHLARERKHPVKEQQRKCTRRNEPERGNPFRLAVSKKSYLSLGQKLEGQSAPSDSAS